MAVGQALCTSGRTTGQNCNFRVEAPYHAAITVGGVKAGYLTSLSARSSSGSKTTYGFRQGDSGGPVYYNNGNGGMMVVGIVKALSSDYKTYYITRLEGVRQWAPGAYVG